MWIISIILLLFYLGLASNCDPSASAFQVLGLQEAHATTRVSISLLLGLSFLSVAMMTYSHQQTTWERNHLFIL